MRCKVISNIKHEDVEDKINKFIEEEGVSIIHNLESNFCNSQGKIFVSSSEKMLYSFLIIYE